MWHSPKPAPRGVGSLPLPRRCQRQTAKGTRALQQPGGPPSALERGGEGEGFRRTRRRLPGESVGPGGGGGWTAGGGLLALLLLACPLPPPQWLFLSQDWEGKKESGCRLGTDAGQGLAASLGGASPFRHSHLLPATERDKRSRLRSACSRVGWGDPSRVSSVCVAGRALSHDAGGKPRCSRGS